MKRPIRRDGGAGTVWARLLERMWFGLNVIFGVKRPGPDRRQWLTIAQDEWRPVLDRLPPDPALREAIEARLLPAYALANGLAVWFAGLHRGAFTLVALLTTGAVIVGPVSVLTPVNPALKLTLIASVLAMITGTVVTTTLSRRGRWHRRWLAYRAEAEALRPLRVLAYAGAAADQVPAPPRVSPHVRERIRTAFAALPPPEDTTHPDYLPKLKAAAFDGPESELGGQIAYHRKEADRMARLDRGLRRTHQVLFFAVGLVCVGVIALTLWRGDIAFVNGIAGVVIAVVPAVAAGLSAIRGQANLEELTERSTTMAKALEALAERGKAADTLDDVRAVLISAIALMSTETAEWQTLIGTRPLTVPV